MQLAASNIAWDVEASQTLYTRMRAAGFRGLEIAPTKFFAPDPYTADNILGVRALSDVLKKAFGLSIVSMQSIWYGRDESIWGSEAEREALLAHTARAAQFAAAAGCRNLVFGCPRNRNRPEGADEALALDFFARAGEAVAPFGVTLALEPNPPIYHTNFLNTTAACAAFLRKVGHPALGMNLDVGAMIENGETAAEVAEYLPLIHHVHISCPGLTPVRPLPLHAQLAEVLRRGGYGGWVSIEMKDAGLAAIGEAIDYVAQVFGG